MTVEPMTDAELTRWEAWLAENALGPATVPTTLLSAAIARARSEKARADAAEAHLSEPARLASARQEGRQEGYREGVEAAIADAVAVSIRDEVDSYEMRDDGGGGYSPTDDERIMLEDFGAGLVAVFEQRLRALTPPPAEPAGGTAEPADWTVSDTELARDILCYLGIGSDASLEPGDRRRDRIAAMICADRERRALLQGQGGGDAEAV